VTRSGRTVKPFVDPIYQTANAVLLNTILSRDATFSDQDRFDVCAALTEVLPGEPGSDPALFLPEPRGLYEIIKLPPHLRKAWLAALVKEFKGLVSNQTFSIEPMKDDDKIMDAMDVTSARSQRLVPSTSSSVESSFVVVTPYLMTTSILGTLTAPSRN